MLKKYKNQFVEFINGFDLGTSDFKINVLDNDENNAQNIELVVKNSPFFFRIMSYPENWNLFWVEFKAFKPTFPTESWPVGSEYMNFEECLTHLEYWKSRHLDEYFEEETRPDLLESFARTKTYNISEINFDTNEPFLSSEKKIIKSGLEEIKLLIREEFDFTQSQIGIIDNRIKYLEEAIDRLNKTDWKSLLISTILSIIISLALDTNNSEKMIKLFSKIIDNIPQLSW